MAVTTNRRTLLQAMAGIGAAGQVAAGAPQPADVGREYWVRLLSRLAEPVLTNLAAGKLKRAMPVECAAGHEADRRKFTHLEALARLLAGVAPWLEAKLEGGPERELQRRYAALAREALRSATDPASPDFLNYSDGGQPVVDCGFLSQAVLRAPRELWGELDSRTQRNLAAALRSSRAITPGYNNWLLFSAMVETALAIMGEPWDGMRIDYAVRKHQEWYLGDGTYGDGPQLHWDYYNSYVIQPMLLDVLRNISKRTDRWSKFTSAAMERARRYASIQERLIAPDGSYPAIGRSITYRAGAFQVLAQMALLGQLPPPLTPAQVRAALTAVLRRTLEAPGTFDGDGWLRIGLWGHQPHLGETYISTGSLYLCSAALLPLGLPASDNFWTSPGEDWTSRKLSSGQDLAADHAI
jgi:hypothetical protein